MTNLSFQKSEARDWCKTVVTDGFALFKNATRTGL